MKENGENTDKLEVFVDSALNNATASSNPRNKQQPCMQERLFVLPLTVYYREITTR